MVDSTCVFDMCPACHLERSEETAGRRGESAAAAKEREENIICNNIMIANE